MRHIKLYEYYSELPTSFSVSDIKKMSREDFLRNLKMLNDKGDEEQAFSLLQIWMDSNPISKDDLNFAENVGAIIGKDLFYNKAYQLDKYHNSLKKPKLVKQIEETKNSIKNYEELLRLAKERLQRLEFEITGM